MWCGSCVLILAGGKKPSQIGFRDPVFNINIVGQKVKSLSSHAFFLYCKVAISFTFHIISTFFCQFTRLFHFSTMYCLFFSTCLLLWLHLPRLFASPREKGHSAPHRYAPKKLSPLIKPVSQSSPPPSTDHSFQATLTGYGGHCDTSVGSCGFLGTPNSFTAAVSVGWNLPSQPGQCGTCWRITDGHNINGRGVKGSAITTPPLVVIISNTCAPNKHIPGFQCNQNAGEPRDRFGSVTVVDLCQDTVAARAFWGGGPGLATATITQVPCEQWKGQVSKFSGWSRYKKSPNGKGVVLKNPGGRGATVQ